MNIILGNLKPRKAEYTMIGLPEHDENPCSSALPLLSRAELGKALNFNPEWNEGMRKLPAKVRKLACERVRNVFICIHRTLDFAEAFQLMMRSSNLSRNPRDDVFWEWREKLIEQVRTLAKEKKLSLKKRHFKKLITLACEESPSMSLWGLPAAGKSGTILRLLQVLFGDRLLIHEQESDEDETAVEGKAGKQERERFYHVPYLYLHCPVNVSAKQAIINLLTQLGTIVGEDLVSEITRKNRQNIEEFALPELINYLFVYNVGAIIIDEVEMIKRAHSGGDEGLQNFWLLLMNCRIPIVLIGNPDAMKWFEKNFKLQHRLCGGGCFIYDKLPNDGGEFTFFLEMLWRHQFTSVETELTEELINAMHRHSGGLTKILIRLYIWVQRLAITKGELGGLETITPELIEEAARLNAKTIEAMISGLYHGKEDKDLATDLQLGALRDLVGQLNDKESNGKETSDEKEGGGPELKVVDVPKPKPRRTICPGKKMPRRITDATKKQTKGDETSYDVYKRMGKLRKPPGA